MPFAVVQATFWDHGQTNFAPDPQPLWAGTAAALGSGRSVSLAGADGSKFATLTLQKHQNGWLVTAVPAGATAPVWLNDPRRGQQSVSLGCCGPAKIPGRFVVSEAAAVQAARHFFTTGGCDPELTWAADGPAGA